MSPVPIPLDVDDLVRRYLAGETCQDLAKVFGASEGTLRRRLKARGVEIRQGPSYRTSDSMATREQRAATRERQLLHAGPQEFIFAALLDDVGIDYVQQRAVGPYNLDFALVEAPIAVEVVSGSGSERSKAMRRQRIEYLLERGWHVVELFHRSGRSVYPFTRGSAIYVHSLLKMVSGKPSERGQHWMIRADGQPIAGRGRQVD